MTRLTLAAAFLIQSLAGPAAAQEIQWGAVAAGGFTNELRVPGHVIAREGALGVESARVAGRVVSILKREGDPVLAGQALFAVNSPECVSLAQEKSAAEERKLQDLVDAARRREEQLGLSVEGAECRILASHDGTLTRRQVELGAAFNIGDPLATILDVSNLTVELDVPERSLPQVKVGQPVRLQLASEPERALSARVEHVLPTIDPVTRSVKVRLSPLALTEGATLDALVFGSIRTGVRQQAFKVPTTSLVFDRNRQFVIKRAGERTVAVPVEVVGEAEDTSTVRPLADDLKAGDQIAVKGALFLLRRSQG